MLFTEPTFLFVFLPVLLALHALPLPKNALLLVASIAFYATGGGAFTWLILISIAVNYGAALRLGRLTGTAAATRLLRITVAANLLVLGVFKYAGFVVADVNAGLALAGFMPVAVPSIALPIGISFFTFHAISYVVDVKRGDAVAQKGPVEAALYLLLFPQLIAGPIIRYRDIAAQLASRAVTRADLADGARRFIIGLAKKMLVANIVAGPADRVFALPVAELTAPLAWLGVACYTLQIYFDFSGYSDMAIGLGRLFGFHFPENFRYPYVATSVQDFWRRWHISLSSWFRDYVYVPLGGSRGSSKRTYVNLVTVFFLCGLWHGASWTFVAWGLFHGVFLVLERLRAERAPAESAPGRAARFGRHAYALLVVMVGWVLFRADTLAGAGGMLQAMAGFGRGLPTTYAVSWYVTPELVLAFGCGVVGATPVLSALACRLRPGSGADGHVGGALGWAPSAVGTAALAVLLGASIMLSAARTYSPFIYFRF
ncbi:MAG TPA: MBOAT family protein [Vicinamibacterales bacterium]|nr:MBOAT family protein [Vicinamibacterales bacterium]